MTDCVFCEIVRTGKYEGSFGVEHDIRTVYFTPLNPVVPGHKLFVNSIHTGDAAESPKVTGWVFKAAAQYGAKQEESFNLITSAGSSATQTVFHLHVHYIPRRYYDGLHLPWTDQEKPRTIKRMVGRRIVEEPFPIMKEN